jgi:STE24 endopeptidase
MIQVLTILLFGSIYLHDEMDAAGRGPDPVTNPIKVAGITLAGFYAIWLAFQLLTMYCGSRIDKTGRVRWIRTAEKGQTLLRIAAAAWWIFALFDLGWLKAVRAIVGDLLLVDELLAMSPCIAVLVGGWWSMYPVERRFHEALIVRQLDDPASPTIHPILSRGQHVWMAARHQMLLWMTPMTLMMGWMELLNFRGDAIAAAINRIHPHWGEALLPIIQWLGTLSIIITTPALMRLVWDTVKIGPGPLADQVHDMCRRYRVRVGGPLLWRTRGTLVNGAILGVFWPLRYMLLSDALLERLTPAQVEGVMAHEVAHVRRHHLIWLAICVVSTAFIGAICISLAVGALQWFTRLRLGGDAMQITSSIIGLAGAALVFGVVSRRFEWQADAFAVQHLSRVQREQAIEQTREQGEEPEPSFPTVPSSPPPLIPSSIPRITPEAVRTMASALQAVADLNGIPPGKFSWRHGSIRQRQLRLLSLVNVPLSRAPIDRQVRVIKLVAAIALALGIASIVLTEAIGRGLAH